MRLQGIAGDYRWKPEAQRLGRRRMTLGPIAFLSPWLLAGLLALPVIWWLLRTVPPRPRRIEFPPTRILVGIENREKTPAKTPWWLTLIRMLAAALVILALAEPVLNPNRETALDRLRAGGARRRQRLGRRRAMGRAHLHGRAADRRGRRRRAARS